VSSTSASEADKRREIKRQEELRRKTEQAESTATTADLDDGFQEIGKAGKKKKDRTKITFGKDEEITITLVMRTLLQIVSQRGKKGVKISDQQKMLRQLRLIANNHNLGEGVDAVIQMQVCSTAHPLPVELLRFGFDVRVLIGLSTYLSCRSSTHTLTTSKLCQYTWRMRRGELPTMTW
jgi:hypothetical protein